MRDLYALIMLLKSRSLNKRSYIKNYTMFRLLGVISMSVSYSFKIWIDDSFLKKSLFFKLGVGWLLFFDLGKTYILGSAYYWSVTGHLS